MLIHPTNYRVYDKVKKGRSKTPPMGIAYLAAVLRNSGFDVELFDAEALNLSIDEIVEHVKQKNPDIIGITCTTPLIYGAVEICNRIKESNQRIVTILGGPHISAMPRQTMELSEKIDYIVLKEAEYSLLELIKALDEKTSVDDIKGIGYRKNNEIIVNSPRDLIENLDELPFPARDLLPQEKYIFVLPATERFIGRYGENFAVIISSRGCPYQCIFCDSCATFGKKVRLRTPKNVVDEIEDVVKEYNIRIFYIDDDTFTISKQRAIDICKEIISRKLDIAFLTTSRVNTIDDELSFWLKKAGCFMVNMGVEAGDERILQVIKKSITKEQVRRAVESVHKYGMYTYLSFMIGNPEETEETIQKTIDFAKELNPFHSQFSIAIPFPGTELWEIAKQNNLIETEDFSKYMWYYSVVFVPKGLTKEKLLELQKKAYEELGHAEEKKIDVIDGSPLQ